MARFFTSSWLVRHVLALMLTVGFAGLGWWQLSRATGGNGISWAYTFEWPLFALFVVALWVREIRAELKQAGTAADPDAPPPLTSPFAQARQSVADTVESTGDAATDAYNRYLAWLADNPGRRPSEYPG